MKKFVFAISSAAIYASLFEVVLIFLGYLFGISDYEMVHAVFGGAEPNNHFVYALGLIGVLALGLSPVVYKNGWVIDFEAVVDKMFPWVKSL